MKEIQKSTLDDCLTQKKEWDKAPTGAGFRNHPQYEDIMCVLLYRPFNLDLYNGDEHQQYWYNIWMCLFQRRIDPIKWPWNMGFYMILLGFWWILRVFPQKFQRTNGMCRPCIPGTSQDVSKCSHSQGPKSCLWGLTIWHFVLPSGKLT